MNWITYNKTARMLLASLLLTAAAAANGSLPTPQPLPTIASFFSSPSFKGARLSPSGRYLAAFVSGEGKRDGLAVVDLSDLSTRMVAQFKETDIGQVRWVNNERLLFSTVNRTRSSQDQDISPSVFAVNRDGKQYRQLSGRDISEESTLLPWHTYILNQDSQQTDDEVYLADAGIADHSVVASVNLVRVNTRTGAARGVNHPGKPMGWLLDQKGEPRLMIALDKGIKTLHYLDPSNGAWRVLNSFNAYSDKNGFEPLAFGPDGALYGIANGGNDLRALYRYDVQNNKLGQRLVTLDGFDFEGSLIISNNTLLGARVHADAESTAWFDPAMQALQKQIDTRLPGLVNLITPPRYPETPWVLVESFSDKQPRRFLVFNTDTKKLNEVGQRAPAIKAESMGARDLVYYKARDGKQIPAWLTLPAGTGHKNLPMVVLVRSDPFTRGADWEWSAEAQFLASRGYAVLEPEFRGSTGYGHAHFRAGWKQWGLAMQDDLADGTRWAISQGTADPSRICIAGSIYGGYAALMGLINDPGLFRCGVNWAGISDIRQMHDIGWRYGANQSQDWKQYGIPQLIGDLVQDADQIKATSPLLRAAEIRQPLLLGYGGADSWRRPSHGNELYALVKKTNNQVDWVEYGQEGRDGPLPENRIDFWQRVEKFLDKNIGAQRAAP